jgi:hypothetical protein
MNITPELVARLIFNISNMRYFQKEFQREPTRENKDLLISFQGKVDEFLFENGLAEYADFEEILSTLTSEPLKQAI